MIGTDRLPCGTPIDVILDQVADHVPPRDPGHQAGCPHCRAALAQATALWRPLARLAGEKVTAPPDLLATVMEQVRQLPRHAWHAVIHTDRGETRIAARVITAVVRLAAAQTPEVTLVVGRPRTGPRDDARVGVAGAHVVIDVQIAVELGSSVPVLADELRNHIREHLRAHTGLATTEINIAVLDVFPREAAKDRAS